MTLGVTGEGFDHKSEVAVRSEVICQEVESPDWDGLRGIVLNVSCSLKGFSMFCFYSTFRWLLLLLYLSGGASHPLAEILLIVLSFFKFYAV